MEARLIALILSTEINSLGKTNNSILNYDILISQFWPQFKKFNKTVWIFNDPTFRDQFDINFSILSFYSEIL